MKKNTQTKQLTGTLEFYHYDYHDKEIFDTQLNDYRITREPEKVIDASYEIPIILPDAYEINLFGHKTIVDPKCDVFRNKMLTDPKFKKFYNALLFAYDHENSIFNKDEISQNTTALIFNMLVYQENPDYNLVLDLLKDLLQEKYCQYFYDRMII